MRTAILIALIMTCPISIFGQGFYDYEPLYINKAAIRNLNVSSVLATCYYPDSSFHSMSNFVFEYRFDNKGNINYKKYWVTNLVGSKYLNITLVVDTGFYLPQFQKFGYRSLAQSQVVKFNQYKERTKNYMAKVLNQFNVMEPSSINCFNASGDLNNLVDTVLLGKIVHVPRWLIPSGDSIVFSQDTLMVFNQGEMNNQPYGKYYSTGNGTLQIDRILNEDTSKVQISFFIDSLGFLSKETIADFSRQYHYNSDGLHVSTETYHNEYRATYTKFIYE